MRPVISSVLLALLAGCGSEYTEDTKAPGTTSSTSSSSSSSSGTATNPDTKTGPVSVPGKVDCGKEACDLTTQVCCIDGASDQKCQPKAAGCTKGSAVCDEAADCPAGKKTCCGSASFNFDTNTVCAPTCDGFTEAQSCRTDAECGSQECIKQSCTGFTAWLCGLKPFCQRL